ncbi:CG10588 [Drosophila busckii]|uniref:CG10588 n=1 Tax=Drosophila busckii TaxID=30019 RepID=A0A0M3QWS4_DROBS|nr:CG10588 [Drosophila busckii]
MLMRVSMSYKRRADLRPVYKQIRKWIQNTSRDMSVTYLELPDKSEGDKKQYRALQLNNGLRALLISDPANDEATSSFIGPQHSRISSKSDSSASIQQYKGKLAACAVLMGVGSFAEPPQFQGLAHFLEHMIFMGSQKYPAENAFDAFISKCGGFSNAHTENEDTCFYFEVEEQYLDQTLDMFMNLMKAPLMNIDAMARERSAVQSEFDQTHMVDEVRRDQLLASMASEGYPHNTFGWGNHKSLKHNVNDSELHQALHDFRRKHYGSNRMIVCLQGELSLDELEQLLLKHCSDIPQSEQQPMDLSQLNYAQAFREEFFRDVLLVQPVEDVCKLELTWVLPPMKPHYKCKPDAFMAQMLGYEGVGSLCSFLRRRLWCMTVMSGVGGSSFESNSMYSLFTVCIYMTDEGFAHLDDVVSATFAWIRMLNDCKTLKTSYSEMQQITANNFRFQIEAPAMENAQSMVENFSYLPSKHVVSGTQLYFEYDEASMKLLRRHLGTFRFNMMITSHIPYENYDYNQKERWFGTSYRSIDMPEKWRDMWFNPSQHPELQVPPHNPFVTTDFTLHWVEAGQPHVSRRPKALIKNEVCELWFRPDDTFLLPDGYINLYFITPMMRQSACEYMAAVLYTYLVEFVIAEQLYPALMAGQGYSLETTDKGLMLRVNGYNQKLHLVLEIILHVMQHIKPTEAMVMSIKELKKRQLFNAVINSKSLNLDLRLTVLENMRFTLLQKYEALKAVTIEDINKFKDNFYKQMFVKALVQGNFKEQHARDLMQMVRNAYPSEQIDLSTLQNRYVQLPLGQHFLRVKSLNSEDTNTIVSNYYQIGPSNLRMECLMDLVDLIVEEPFFNQLRTQEQLAYSLGLYQRIGYGIQAFVLNINTQESKHRADFVEGRLEAFRASMPALVRQLSEEEFNQLRDTLVNSKKLGNLSLHDEVMRNWSEITSGEYFFNRTEMQIQTISQISQEEVIDFLINYEEKNLRKLSVQVVGRATGSMHSPTQSIAESVSARQGSTTHVRRSGSLAMMVYEVQRNISEEQLLFEQIGERVKLEFIGDVTNPSHIIDIEAFKRNLHVYPFINTNPKLSSKT